MKTVVNGLATFALVMSIAGVARADDDWKGGDAAKGEKVFKKCQACHTVEDGGPNRVGPNLHGILDRPAAFHEGYNYSAAMKKKASEGLKWSEKTSSNISRSPRPSCPAPTCPFRA